MSNKKIHIEEFPDCLIDWAKDIYVPGPTGELILLNTVIRINNQLIALDPYTDEELDKLETTIKASISYERSRRRSSNTEPDVSG